MRRASILLAAALLAPLGACGATGGASPESDARAALLRPGDIPGSWSLVGTTDRRPQVGDTADPLDDAKGATPTCRSALDALEVTTTGPAPTSADRTAFARAVYRSNRATPSADDRDLTLTVEDARTASDRAAAVMAVTSACAKPLTTRAGTQRLVVRITPTSYSTPGATGYTVAYDADGLKHYFDMVVVVSGTRGVTTSITGPDRPANRRLLDAVATRTLTRLGAPAGPSAT